MNKTVTLHSAWTGEADCRNCQLRNTVLFSGLEEEDFEKIHQPIDQYVMPPGSYLYRMGEKANHMYTVRSGTFKLVQYLPDGSQRIVRLARTTDITGLEALLDQNYQHDAIALQPSEVCKLPVPVIKKLSSENPNLHQELLNRWNLALTQADAWLTHLSTGSAKQRIARLLLHVFNNPDLSYPLFSREDIGSMLAITTETSSRIIAEFKRKKLLVETAPQLYRLNVEELEAIAQE
ncbi:MAG: Crp/Fnr family transcriptional regulator [Gammaproteobacteria bacterium]|nr:Crp/Fnr family transcriptional regulator [Gammaproteobacteria bacterium]NNJ90474.1 Crp/Fnr family transcriptional regulator [Gammaproteobacteria bacterium]